MTKSTILLFILFGSKKTKATQEACAHRWYPGADTLSLCDLLQHFSLPHNTLSKANCRPAAIVLHTPQSDVAVLRAADELGLACIVVPPLKALRESIRSFYDLNTPPLVFLKAPGVAFVPCSCWTHMSVLCLPAVSWVEFFLSHRRLHKYFGTYSPCAVACSHWDSCVS